MQAKIISISQQKGGAGKTTLTSHLAVALSYRGNKVAIIDTDPQGSLTQWYQERERLFGSDNTRLKFIASIGWKLQSTITELQNYYDFILIDTPPHTEADAKTAIRVADLVLIPLQPSPTDLWAISATISIVQKEKKNFKIVLNRIAPNNRFIKEIPSNFANYLLSNYLGNRVTFSHSLSEGKTVIESDAKSQAALEIKGLAEEVEQILLNQKIVEEVE